jgi:hypothetical protein
MLVVTVVSGGEVVARREMTPAAALAYVAAMALPGVEISVEEAGTPIRVW